MSAFVKKERLGGRKLLFSPCGSLLLSIFLLLTFVCLSVVWRLVISGGAGVFPCVTAIMCGGIFFRKQSLKSISHRSDTIKHCLIQFHTLGVTKESILSERTGCLFIAITQLYRIEGIHHRVSGVFLMPHETWNTFYLNLWLCMFICMAIRGCMKSKMFPSRSLQYKTFKLICCLMGSVSQPEPSELFPVIQKEKKKKMH